MEANFVLGEDSFILTNKKEVVPIGGKVLLRYLLWQTHDMQKSCARKSPCCLSPYTHTPLYIVKWGTLKIDMSAAYIKYISFFLVKNAKSIIKAVWGRCQSKKWGLDCHRPQHIPSISRRRSITRACTFICSKWKFQDPPPPRLLHGNQCCPSDIESILIVKSLPAISICMWRKARSILSHSLFSSSTQTTTQVEMQG